MTDIVQSNDAPVQTEEVKPTPVVEGTPTEVVGEETTTQESGLPENVTDRTREQFEKLTDSNKKLLEANKLLYQELAKKNQSEQTFAPIQQPNIPDSQGVKIPDVDKFVEIDPITGEQYVDETKLRTAISDANARAVRAEQAVTNYIRQQQAVEEDKQTREAFTTYPELNPGGGNFDKEMHRRTRSILLDSMMNPTDYDGRALTFKEAADMAKSQTDKEATQLEKKVEGQRQESLANKEEASLEATGKTGFTAPATQSAEDSDLVRRTRLGDPWALAQRLSKIPHTGTAKSSGEGE